MPSPDPSYIVASAPPLNTAAPWPYVIDEFPADTILGQLGSLAPAQIPRDPSPVNPLRVEPS